MKTSAPDRPGEITQAPSFRPTLPGSIAAPTALPDFDPLARPYRWIEYLTFGPLLQRCRTQFLLPQSLPHLRNCRRALILGDGDGRFTQALMGALPAIHVHAVDASPAMLAALTRRVGQAGASQRLSTELADLRQWTPQIGVPYDLVATHFFLDCLTTREVESLAARLDPCLAAASQWLVSDFAVPSTPFGHLIARPLVAALYLAFRLLTGLDVNRLPAHQFALQQNGWKLAFQRPRLHGLLVSELWVRHEFDGHHPAT